MKRRIITAIVAIFSLVLIFGFFVFLGAPKHLDSLSISVEEANQLINERELNTSLDISSLRINGYKPFASGNELYYSAVENDSNFDNPSIRIKPGLKIAFYGEPISANSIEYNIPLTAIVYDDKSYRQLSLTTTTLPILSIDFDDGNVPDDRNNEKFSMTLFDNREGVIDRYISSDGKAHKRGGASFSVSKPSMKLNLTKESPNHNTRDNSISILGMQERSEYVLSAMYYDQEKFRDMFGATIWREASGEQNDFGLDLSYDWRYVEVIANGDYYGLYMLGYKPDEQVFEVNTEGEHPDIFFKAAEGEDLSDFILGKTDFLVNFELESDTNYIDSYNVLREYLRAMFGNDPQKALEWTDYKNAIDFWLFTNITQNEDIPRWQGMVKNSYFVFKWDEKSSHYKALFIPWDHDIGMGSNWLIDTGYVRSADNNVFLTTDYVALLHRVNDSKIDSALWARYWELRRSVLNFEYIDKIIDKHEAEIFNSGAFRRNMERWPESAHIDPSLKLSEFKNFAHARISYLDSNLLNEENAQSLPYTIPNFITVYLETGVIMSPDDPEYLTKAPEEVEPEYYLPEF